MTTHIEGIEARGARYRQTLEPIHILKTVPRALKVVTPCGYRAETTAEHTASSMLTAIKYDALIPAWIKRDRLYQLLCIHDLPESGPGDVPCYESKTAAWREAEAATARQIFTTELERELWEEWEAHETDESIMAHLFDVIDGAVTSTFSYYKNEKYPPFERLYAPRFKKAFRRKEDFRVVALELLHIFEEAFAARIALGIVEDDGHSLMLTEFTDNSQVLEEVYPLYIESVGRIRELARIKLKQLAPLPITAENNCLTRDKYCRIHSKNIFNLVMPGNRVINEISFDSIGIYDSSVHARTTNLVIVYQPDYKQAYISEIRANYSQLLPKTRNIINPNKIAMTFIQQLRNNDMTDIQVPDDRDMSESHSAMILVTLEEGMTCTCQVSADGVCDKYCPLCELLCLDTDRLGLLENWGPNAENQPAHRASHVTQFNRMQLTQVPIIHMDSQQIIGEWVNGKIVLNARG